MNGQSGQAALTVHSYCSGQKGTNLILVNGFVCRLEQHSGQTGVFVRSGNSPE